MQSYSGIDVEATCNRIACFIGISGYSDKELATILGTSVQSVNKWRHAHNLPDIENMYVISRMFGVLLDDLIISCDRSKKKFISDVRDRAAEYTAFLSVLFAAGKKLQNSAYKYAKGTGSMKHCVDYALEGINLCFCN